MAGEETTDNTRTGLAKVFNTHTAYGRRNCTIATLTGYFIIFLAFKLSGSKKKKHQEVPPAKTPKSC